MMACQGEAGRQLSRACTEHSFLKAKDSPCEQAILRDGQPTIPLQLETCITSLVRRLIPILHGNFSAEVYSLSTALIRN